MITFSPVQALFEGNRKKECEKKTRKVGRRRKRTTEKNRRMSGRKKENLKGKKTKKKN